MHEHDLSPKQRRRHVARRQQPRQADLPNSRPTWLRTDPTSCGSRTSPTSPLRRASFTSGDPGCLVTPGRRLRDEPLDRCPSTIAALDAAVRSRAPPAAACIIATAVPICRSLTASCSPSISSRARSAGVAVPTTTPRRRFHETRRSRPCARSPTDLRGVTADMPHFIDLVCNLAGCLSSAFARSPPLRGSNTPSASSELRGMTLSTERGAPRSNAKRHRRSEGIRHEHIASLSGAVIRVGVVTVSWLTKRGKTALSHLGEHPRTETPPKRRVVGPIVGPDRAGRAAYEGKRRISSGRSPEPAAEQHVLEYLVPWDWVCRNGAGARGNGDGPRSSFRDRRAIPGSSQRSEGLRSDHKRQGALGYRLPEGTVPTPDGGMTVV